jgi:hypothetical protein
MLSSDRLEPGPSRRRKKGRGGAKAHAGTARTDPARAPQNQPEPWDAESAEALMRLYESDEGQLHKPFAGERARHGGARADISPALEQHLSDLAERLEDSLARLDPDASFAALNGRLEAIEQRFGQALERIAQCADPNGLLAVEAHVLNLAEHLERTRERLERIGTLDEQVRGLSERLDAADQRQLGALGKLLRDYIGEWRESEQRTASALHSLEEAVHRLGDAVDAMEASKPAPDLSLPTVAAAEPGRDRGAVDPLSPADGGRALAPKSYHSLLDAADYAPKAAANDRAAPYGAKPAPQADTPISWSAADHDHDAHNGPAERDAGLRASRITSLRARLRQTQVPRDSRHDDAQYPPPLTDRDAPLARRTRPGLLLIAGVAFLAGGAYLLVHALTAATPLRPGPARIEPAAKPAGAQSDLADPTRRRLDTATPS